jgi:hypothetical protein
VTAKSRFSFAIRCCYDPAASVAEFFGGEMLKWIMWAALLAPVLVFAQDCPSAANRVANCGFDTSVSGYTPQDPGDTIAHVSNVGATALGAMRVTDTVADGNTDAEAETCVNVDPGVYRLAASFRAISANTCFVGFDEHVQPNCAAPNGNFVAGTPIAVNGQTFTRFENQTARIAGAVKSVELVILCAAGSVSAQFDVDDVAMVELRIFGNGFE